MMRLRFFAFVPMMALLAMVAACGGGGSSSSSASSASATSTPATSAVASTPAAGVSGTPSSSDAAPGGGRPGGPGGLTRVSGKVQSVSGDKVTLADGSSFQLAPNPRVTKQSTIAATDLAQGQFVAVTAKRQPDNTLLASMVLIFPASFNIKGAQFTQPDGNLMTNATIDSISGTSFTVTFPGGGAQIKLAPGATLLKQTDATLADLTPGSTVSAGVNASGTAMQVTIQ